VVNKWLGHGKGIAEKHYLQTTDADWTDGATTTTVPMARGNTGGNTPANVGAYGSPKQKAECKKAREYASTGFDVSTKVPPLGYALTEATTVKASSKGSGTRSKL